MFCTSCGSEIKGNSKFCTNCGSQQISVVQKTSRPFLATKKLIFSGVGVLLIGFIFLLAFSQSSEERDRDIASAVVNIYCEGEAEDEGSGGSGTIITEEGLVLTNSHIIPQDKEGTLPDDKKCVVILPDSSSGAPKEIYYAKPIIVPGLSDEYDLAFMQIHDVYYDQEEGKALGEYPKTFPAYDSSKYCKTESIKLGEPVKVYGYPAITGGSALTVTDGVVSSLLADDGLIVTSAKIDHGNSGGLAVDENGCMIGIPSQVSQGEFESLGIIISTDLIRTFLTSLDNYVDLAEGTPVIAKEPAIIGTKVSKKLSIPAALRECPIKSCEVIRYYSEGAIITVTGEDKEQVWYKVEAHDDSGKTISGWMHKTVFE